MSDVDEDLLLRRARRSIESCRKGPGEVRVLRHGSPVEGAKVRAVQMTHDFLFGCNIYMFDRFPTPAESERYAQSFARLFNYATVGFYWRSYEPHPGEPQYGYTDRVVAWCRRRGIRLKGHPLLWDHEAGRPVWAGDQQPPTELQKRRVREIVGRYRGRIDTWEVVNEPSHCRGLAVDGPYRWAREANPDAYLIINDYHVMANGYPPFYRLLQETKLGGAPFDGIVIQAHEPRTMRFPLAGVRDTLDTYAGLGKDLHITEFTPASAGEPITGSNVKGRWDEAAQAEYATKFYTMCFGHPAVVAITWWDLCDRGSWLKGGGMLREDLSPKPVFRQLERLINRRWRTEVEGRTDASGSLRFRGFYGRYKIEVASGAGRVARRHSLSRRRRNVAVVELQA